LQSGLLLVSAPGVDAAILDIQLGDHSSVPIAEALQAKAFGLPSRADMEQAACLKDFGIIRSFKSPSQSRSLNAA
jgi:hypothetical protein